MDPTILANEQVAVDDVRQILCAHLAQTLRGGVLSVKVRVFDSPCEALFYAHSDNVWHIQDLAFRDAARVRALADELTRLAAKPHGDLVQVRQHATPHWRETELQFANEAIKRHSGGSLESYIRGILFGDHHDSKQDVRRRMRTPR